MKLVRTFGAWIVAVLFCFSGSILILFTLLNSFLSGFWGSPHQPLNLKALALGIALCASGGGIPRAMIQHRLDSRTVAHMALAVLVSPLVGYAVLCLAGLLHLDVSGVFDLIRVL